jgi:hypothetical protein
MSEDMAQAGTTSCDRIDAFFTRRRFSSDSPGSLFDRLQDVGHYLGTRLGAEVAFAVDANTDGVRFQVAVSDDEHGVDFHLLGVRDLGFDVIGARIELGADLVRAELAEDRTRVI